MTLIANLQYAWTLFVNPMQAAFGWDRSAIQVAFTIFVVCETWFVPIHGYLVDSFGPRLVVLLGGALIGAAWVLNAKLSSLPLLYLAQAIGGFGAGAVYAACLGNALKWFPDRRGLAAGVTAAGFGLGSALTIVPISLMIKDQGFQHTFLFFGLLQGVAVCICALLLKMPMSADAQAPEIARDLYRRQYSPAEMLKTPVFWLMYLMFVMMAAGGLMATAQLGPIAKDFGVAAMPVSLVGITLPALTFALSIDRLLNGITRPLFGWVSDRIGREVDNVHRFRARRARHPRAQQIRAFARHVRCVDGSRVLRVGRNLQPVSGDIRRYVRREIRGGECGPPLHRQGNRRPACSFLQHAHRRHRQLASGILDRRGIEYRHRFAGRSGALPVAAADGRFRKARLI